MKITYKTICLLATIWLSVGLVGCSKDDDTPNTEGENIPEFILGQESVRVKAGAENKVVVNITQGGGEYNAFILDERIAKASVTDGVIKIEGFQNGLTSLIITDKYNRYRKLPVTVYMTDELILSHKEFELISLLGNANTGSIDVVLGNGGYEVVSDNPAVKVAANEEGKISITATSKKKEIVANVTVKDCTGLQASFVVKVVASFVPFTETEKEKIKADAERRYVVKGNIESQSFYNFLNEVLENGKQRYGWDVHGVYFRYIDFNGGKSVGVKTDATCTSNMDGLFFQPIDLEVIKNDGTHIWVIFSFVDDAKETIYSGYFCDAV